MTFENETDDPARITLKELRETGGRLGLNCRHCNRFRYLNAGRFDDTETLASLSDKLTCARCRSGDVEVLAVQKDPETGFWPAERS